MRLCVVIAAGAFAASPAFCETSTPLAGSPLPIMHLRTRDAFITVTSIDGVERYTIKDTSGKILATNIMDAELKLRFPEAYRNVQNGIAGNDARLLREPRKFPSSTGTGPFGM